MTEPESRPLDESYWVLPRRLLAGEYPGQYEENITRQRIDALLEAGFDTFIDLTNEHEVIPYVGILREEAGLYDIRVTHERFSIGDFGLPTFQKMNLILDTIDNALQSGRKIYLHCWGGIGRTGTTVGCYLVRQGMSGEEALNQLSAWWRTVPKSRYHPYSPETRQQTEFIRQCAGHDTSFSRAE